MAEGDGKGDDFQGRAEPFDRLSSAAMPKEITPPKPCFICFLANSWPGLLGRPG